MAWRLQTVPVEGGDVILTNAATAFAAIMTCESFDAVCNPDDTSTANAFAAGGATNELRFGTGSLRMSTAGTIPTSEVERRCVERLDFRRYCRTFLSIASASTQKTQQWRQY